MAEPTMAQVRAAMEAMINKAMETPNEPVAMAIVDSAGNLLAYQTMDNLRIFSRPPRPAQGPHLGTDGPGFRRKRPAPAQPGPQHRRPGRPHDDLRHRAVW